MSDKITPADIARAKATWIAMRDKIVARHQQEMKILEMDGNLLSSLEVGLSAFHQRFMAPPQLKAVGSEPSSTTDASPAVRGGVSVDLDLDGRLLRFVASPARQRVAAPSTATDWQRLFALAGLDRKNFQEIGPSTHASIQTDTRIVWSGWYPGRPDVPVRVEGGGDAGRGVSGKGEGESKGSGEG